MLAVILKRIDAVNKLLQKEMIELKAAVCNITERSFDEYEEKAGKRES